VTKQIRLVAHAACISTLAPLGAPSAHAIQCRAAPPSNAQQPWTYRLIDGRKCWYEGKNMISKSLLQWSAPAPVTVDSDDGSKRAPTEKHINPLDSQAWVPDDSDTFDSRWRALAMGR
jgi:hypothetical protein